MTVLLCTEAPLGLLGSTCCAFAGPALVGGGILEKGGL